MRAMLKPVSAELEAWTVAHAAAKATGRLELTRPACFALDESGELREVAGEDPAALIRWNPAAGWESLLESDSPQRDLLELYLPICSASRRPADYGRAPGAKPRWLHRDLLGRLLHGDRPGEHPASASIARAVRCDDRRRRNGGGGQSASDDTSGCRQQSGARHHRPGLPFAGRHTVFSDQQASTLRASVVGGSTLPRRRVPAAKTLLEVRARRHRAWT